jgi:hypothetical protein
MAWPHSHPFRLHGLLPCAPASLNPDHTPKLAYLMYGHVGVVADSTAQPPEYVTSLVAMPLSVPW